MSEEQVIPAYGAMCFNQGKHKVKIYNWIKFERRFFLVSLKSLEQNSWREASFKTMKL